MFKLFIICCKTIFDVILKKKNSFEFGCMIRVLFLFFFFVSIPLCKNDGYRLNGADECTEEFMGFFRWRIVRCAWQENWRNFYLTPTDISLVSLTLSQSIHDTISSFSSKWQLNHLRQPYPQFFTYHKTWAIRNRTQALHANYSNQHKEVIEILEIFQSHVFFYLSLFTCIFE